MAIVHRAIAVALLSASCGPSKDDRPDPSADTDVAPAVVHGGPTLHRLARAHLAYGVQDLLGVTPDMSPLPEDPSTSGFDTLGGSLSISPDFLISWQAIVEQVAVEATSPGALDQRWMPQDTRVTLTDTVAGEDAWIIGPDGRIDVSVYAPVAGDYTLSYLITGANGADAPPVQPWMSAHTDETDVVITPLPDGRVSVVAHDTLEKGWQWIWIAQGAAEGVTSTVDAELRDLTLVGPDGGGAPNPARDALFPCEPDALAPATDWSACAAQVLHPLARRAWRVGDADMSAWIDAAVADARAAGEPFSEVIRHGLERVLLSPQLLLRAEVGDGGDALTDVELATRLAAFLWSSLPDDALLDVALADDLHTPEVYDAQIARMLADPKAKRLADEFGGQWIGYKRLAGLELDPTLFPELDDTLRQAMTAELLARFASVLSGEDPVQALLTSSRATVSPELAALYGLPQGGADLDLSAQGRVGVLGTAGVLALTSKPHRTSATHRGLWALTNLLCLPTIEKPPNAPPLIEDGDIRAQADYRMTEPGCAVCHTVMDPPGLVLETFDPLGRTRAAYPNGDPIDPATALADGTPVSSLPELADALAADDRFPRCVTDRAWTWALGRPMSSDDEPLLARTEATLHAAGDHLPAVLDAILHDPAFWTLEGTR